MAALVRGEWDAVRRVSTSLAKPLASEMCDLADAYGRVLASDVRSLIDLPAADVSAMDGWAVSGDSPWQIRGRLVNGTTPDGPLGAQEAIGIGTGGVVPTGATAIVRREHGDVLDGQLRWAPPAGAALSLKDAAARTLGPDPRLTCVLLKRLADVSATRDDVVVLAGAGSTNDIALRSVDAAARLMGTAWGSPIPVGHVGGKANPIEDVVSDVARCGRRVVVAS